MARVPRKRGPVRPSRMYSSPEPARKWCCTLEPCPLPHHPQPQPHRPSHLVHGGRTPAGTPHCMSPGCSCKERDGGHCAVLPAHTPWELLTCGTGGTRCLQHRSRACSSHTEHHDCLSLGRGCVSGQWRPHRWRLMGWVEALTGLQEQLPGAGLALLAGEVTAGVILVLALTEVARLAATGDVAGG